MHVMVAFHGGGEAEASWPRVLGPDRAACPGNLCMGFQRLGAPCFAKRPRTCDLPGNLNMMFTKPGSMLVEVRPKDFGTKHKWWPNMWYPLVAHQSGFKYLWYAINIEDPTLNE